jgi:hypothetical protein
VKTDNQSQPSSGYHRGMKFCLPLLALVTLTVLQARQAAPDVIVTVQYTGKATVSEQTPIWVFLFNTPQPGEGTPPIAAKTLAKNGGTVEFPYGGNEQIYVFVVFDAKGNYDGNTGPPPAGTPIGSYSSDGKGPTPVKVTQSTKLKIVFDDSVVYKP